MTLNHWFAIALAIPGRVRLLFFHLSGLGGILCTLATLPWTISVGRSGGSPFSQRQVAFVSPWPNCHGWIIWSGLRHLVDIMPTGFSSATWSLFASAHAMKNSTAARCSACRPANQRAPDAARCVHGGKAITRSHLCLSRWRTSSLTCLPGSSDSSRSADQASAPRRANASRTLPENSHAIRTLICAC